MSAGNQLESLLLIPVPPLQIPQILSDGCIDHFGLKVYILWGPRGEHQVLFLVVFNLVGCIMASVMAVLVWLHLDKGVVGSGHPQSALCRHGVLQDGVLAPTQAEHCLCFSTFLWC